MVFYCIIVLSFLHLINYIQYRYGIKSDGTGKVTEINLSNNFMSGKLPDSICSLTSLTKLDLSRNRIMGKLLIYSLFI